MKKIIYILTAIILVLCLVGCDEELSQEDFPTTTYAGTSTNDEYIKAGNIVYIWTDAETGVQYLIYNDFQEGGITPRLNADGTLYVVDGGEK